MTPESTDKPDRLLQRGRGEIEIERTVGLAAVAVRVPIAGVVQIEASELQPGPAVVGRGGEVAAQQVDGHLALALALEGGGAGGHVGIDGALGVAGAPPPRDAKSPAANAQRSPSERAGGVATEGRTCWSMDVSR